MSAQDTPAQDRYLLNIIKRWFCDHDLNFVRNIHGEEIILSGYKRSVWRCKKCGAYALKDALHRPAHGSKNPEMVDWAVGKWNAEVARRPLVNVHRRRLDRVWREVIAQAGGDVQALIGPDHDTLVAAAQAAETGAAHA